MCTVARLTPSAAVVWFALPLLFGLACGPAPQASYTEDDEAATADLRADGTPAYRDVEETFSNEADQERWFQLKRRLRQDFDDVCGDTFCEGDFTNLQAMSFRCSAATRTGQLKSCLWLFAGSYETVTASTGNVRPVAKFFPCKLPVQGSPNDLAIALLGPGAEPAIRRPLPGQTQSIYELLGTCL